MGNQSGCDFPLTFPPLSCARKTPFKTITCVFNANVFTLEECRDTLLKLLLSGCKLGLTPNINSNGEYPVRAETIDRIPKRTFVSIESQFE
ncbi:hypothetical protein AYI69_g6739 [Smittium culicis]|uniref:Uncharacterized protein n=1 Tax=Smittium culicis TaxID=133412 RepID=A0A1R1XWU9_9FUNG|nr:hypothetical protein AYI69_g6739 [Smittium culicis]